MAWQNIACDLVGIALLCLGIFGRNVQFHERHSGAQIPNRRGRLFFCYRGRRVILARGTTYSYLEIAPDFCAADQLF